MKIQVENGNWFTRDHPNEIISPNVMRFETIRYWLKELSKNPDYGWSDGGVKGLERCLGMAPDTLRDKLRWSWIWPKEQVRLTARINDVLQGYFVPQRFGKRVDGVWTDPPRPPVVRAPPRVVQMKVGIGRLAVLTHSPPPRLKLPQFDQAFQNVRFWDPDKKAR